jgi:hypothetical protein
VLRKPNALQRTRPSRSGCNSRVPRAGSLSLAGIRLAKHYPFLGFLPEPVDGWSDITALYVGCYGVPPVGAAILIRTRQHIDGWTDNPIVTRAIVRPG